MLSELVFTPTLQTPPSLSSGIDQLDQMLGGGLPIGGITEWGVPLGFRGRELLLPWLAHLTAPRNYSTAEWVLWVYPWDYLSIYPPAFAAHGVALPYTRFAKSVAPIRDLRPVFLEPFFRMIVLDAPTTLSEQDITFLARQARILKQSVVILRNNYLTKANSHVLIKKRINCYFRTDNDTFELEVLRGATAAPQKVKLSCLS